MNRASEAAHFRHFLNRLKRGMKLRKMSTVDFLMMITKAKDAPAELRDTYINHVYGAAELLDEDVTGKLLLK